MKQHKIIMRPAGFGRIPERFIPEGAEMIGYATEAGLMGTMHQDGTVYSGLLTEDQTFVIDDAHIELINRPALLAALRIGKVHKRLSVGTISYEIKAKLILITQPFVPSKEVVEIFDIEVWEPKMSVPQGGEWMDFPTEGGGN